MFSNKMFRLYPSFQVLFNENLARFLSVLGQVSNKVSDNRSRVLQRSCQPVRWSYSKYPCIERSVLSQKYSSANNRPAGTVYPLSVFTSLPLAYTVEFFNSVGSAETLNPWHLIKRLVQNLRWHSMCTAGSAGNSSVTLPSPQSTKPRPMRL